MRAKPTLGERCTGLLGLWVALGLVRVLPLRASVTLVRWLHKRPHRPATRSEALAHLAAVRAASVTCAGRVACLERPLAAVLAAALHRRRLMWCIGAQFLPTIYHAWAEIVDGRPVGEVEDPDQPLHHAIRV